MNCQQLLPAVAAVLLSDLIPFQVQTHMPSLNNPKLELRSTYNSSRIPRRNIPKRSCKAPTDFNERRIGAVGEGAYLYSVQSHFKLNTKHWTQDLNIGKPSLSKLSKFHLTQNLFLSSKAPNHIEGLVQVTAMESVLLLF